VNNTKDDHEDDAAATDEDDVDADAAADDDVNALGGVLRGDDLTSSPSFRFANSAICASSAARMAAALSRRSMNASASKSLIG